MSKFKIGDYVKSDGYGIGYWIVKDIFKNEGGNYVYVVCARDKTHENVLFFEHQLSLLKEPMFREGESIYVNALYFTIKHIKLGLNNTFLYDVSFIDYDANIERTVEISEELFFIIHKG